MNENIKEIYDIIMNDEETYELYMRGAFDIAIEEATRASQIYGNPITLTSGEWKKLVSILESEKYGEY